MASIKKIPIFIGGTGIGGIERILFNLAASFAKMGIHVDLIMTGSPSCTIPYIKGIKNIRIINTGNQKLRNSIPFLIGYLKKESPEFIISGSPSNTLLLIFARYLARSRTKIVGGIHCIISRARKTDLTVRGIFIGIKLFFRYVDIFIAGSEYAANDFAATAGIDPKKIKLVYNPSIPDNILLEADGVISHPWLQDKKIPVILGVGRLDSEKNFQLLVRAFGQLRKKIDSKLIIVGDGKEKASLEKLVKNLKIENYVSFTGPVQSPYPYMKRASVIVVPSLHEALNTVIIEALAIGTPVVATDCPGGNKEILDNGRFGKLVKENDHLALCDAIIETLNSSFDTEALKERSKMFYSDTAAKKYLEVLSSL